jgi:hypothetical protein
VCVCVCVVRLIEAVRDAEMWAGSDVDHLDSAGRVEEELKKAQDLEHRLKNAQWQTLRKGTVCVYVARAHAHAHAHAHSLVHSSYKAKI